MNTNEAAALASADLVKGDVITLNRSHSIKAGHYAGRCKVGGTSFSKGAVLTVFWAAPSVDGKQRVGVKAAAGPGAFITETDSSCELH